MTWPHGRRTILWRDFTGVTHVFQQSFNHPNDWNIVCDTLPWELGSRDNEKIMASIRAAAVVPVDGPVTCVRCAARFTE